MWRKLILWPLAAAAAIATAVLVSWLIDAFDIVAAFRAGRPTVPMAVGVFGLALIGGAGFDIVRVMIRAALRPARASVAVR